ncbi:hypothetical protein [Novacetimonas hansenii]|uniref:hypothetical protein n=1 Tax=Novacetimonas hansenii TaxID=436 RepID=UPI001C37E439|nr:hypothetical protein [Novacetimonas hansenii]
MDEFAGGQGHLLVEQTKPFEDPSGDDVLVMNALSLGEVPQTKQASPINDLIDEPLTAHQ